MELKTMQKPEEDEEEEILLVKKFETKLMADGFSFMEKALTIFENQDPSFERFPKVATSVRDSFQYYRIIYVEKKKKTVQTSLNQFFNKRSDPQENVKSVEHVQKNVEPMPLSPLHSSSNAASSTNRCNSITYRTVH